MDILPPVPKTKKPFRLGRCETLSGGRSGIQCSASSLIDEMASCYSSSLRQVIHLIISSSLL